MYHKILTIYVNIYITSEWYCILLFCLTVNQNYINMQNLMLKFRMYIMRIFIIRTLHVTLFWWLHQGCVRWVGRVSQNHMWMISLAADSSADSCSWPKEKQGPMQWSRITEGCAQGQPSNNLPVEASRPTRCFLTTLLVNKFPEQRVFLMDMEGRYEYMDLNLYCVKAFALIITGGVHAPCENVVGCSLFVR
jgi:hypothetical protein